MLYREINRSCFSDARKTHRRAARKECSLSEILNLVVRIVTTGL